MGNTTSTPEGADASVEAITYTNPHQRQQQSLSGHGQTQQQPHQQSQQQSHQYFGSHPQDPNPGGSYGYSYGGSISPRYSSPPNHPASIPIATMPVQAPPRSRFPHLKEAYQTESPLGSSPMGSDTSSSGTSHPLTGASLEGHYNNTNRAHYQPGKSILGDSLDAAAAAAAAGGNAGPNNNNSTGATRAQQSSLPGGGLARRRASSLSSGPQFSQYAQTFNEQAIIASAAHQDRMQNEVKVDYRNSARVSRAFGDLEPLKRPDDHSAHDGGLNGNVPTIITWSQGGTNVYVTGTFNNWKQKVRLSKSTSDFSTVLNLPPGTHRIKFIVDDEWKCSTELSAATDAEGNLVNFLEVADEEQDELDGGQYTPINGSPPGSYTDQIPAYALSQPTTPQSGISGSDAIGPLTSLDGNSGNNGTQHQSSTGHQRSPSQAVNSGGGRRPSNSSMKSTSSSTKSFPPSPPLGGTASTSSGSGSNNGLLQISSEPPPSLPPHLEKVILNNVPPKEDNAVLPVPNHVVLNHLYACSVREGVLSISATSRYRKKYITTVFIKPVVGL